MIEKIAEGDKFWQSIIVGNNGKNRDGG